MKRNLNILRPNISSMTGDMRKVKVTRVAARRMKVRAVLVTMILVALAGLSSYVGQSSTA